MPRRNRTDPPGGWHHVMSRGIERKPIFFDDEDRVLFGYLLGDVHDEYAVEVHAYCLMDNHFHLVLRCPESGISDVMHHLLSVFARRVNDRVGRWGHLYGGRFESRLLTTHGYIANVVRYIHRNPLDIAGVASPASYRWSSHRHYLGRRATPHWLFTEEIGGWFDHPTDFDAFVSGIELRLPTTHSEQPIVEDDLLDAVWLVSKEVSDASPRHLPAQRRAVALNLLTSITPEHRDRVLSALGLTPGTGALRSAHSRARSLARSEYEVRVMEQRVALLLGLPWEPQLAA